MKIQIFPEILTNFLIQAATKRFLVERFLIIFLEYTGEIVNFFILIISISKEHKLEEMPHFLGIWENSLKVAVEVNNLFFHYYSMFFAVNYYLLYFPDIIQWYKYCASSDSTTSRIFPITYKTTPRFYVLFNNLISCNASRVWWKGLPRLGGGVYTIQGSPHLHMKGGFLEPALPLGYATLPSQLFFASLFLLFFYFPFPLISFIMISPLSILTLPPFPSLFLSNSLFFSISSLPSFFFILCLVPTCFILFWTFSLFLVFFLPFI